MSFLLRSILFLFLVSSFLNTYVSPTQHLCNHDQKDALLKFKSEFRIFQMPASVYSDISCYPKTESWMNNSDCCSWDGITCDAKSGQVIGLDLTCSGLHGRLESNSSLFQLFHLRNLNLAYNNFTSSPIPAELYKLTELKTLNLSVTSFSGQIPTKLLQLTKLVSLDLSSRSMFSENSLSIEESFLRSLARNLRNLRELDMSLVNISSEIPTEFSYMWSLRSLSLGKCNLLGEFPSSVLLIPNLQSISLIQNPNLTGSLPVFHENNSLLELIIQDTSFSGTIPESISNLKHLTSLILSYSNFSGKIPFSLGNLSHLSSLSLSVNSFVGEIPSSVGNLKKLTGFTVEANKLSGNFPSTLLNCTQLHTINLGSNQFTGFLPPNISQLSKLKYFSASRNSFTGAIPSSLFKLPSLITLSLDDNQLNDLLGIDNITSSDLHILSIGSNNFNINPVDLNVFLPLKQLTELELAGIPLSTANITYDSGLLSELYYLYLSGCNITEFPEFTRNNTNLVSLDLSNNKIKGQVPDWLWRLPQLTDLDLSYNSLTGFNGSLKAYPGNQIITIDLSSNAFQGPIFIPSSYVRYYFAPSNNFSGEIPLSVCEIRSLTLLDLSNNNLRGSIHPCLGDHISSLLYLNLHKNRLQGTLPNIFMEAKNLRSLDVGHNRLVGKLPKSLIGCSSLEVLNVGNNQINDTFPFWLNSLQQLQVLVLRSNEFRGALHHPRYAFGFHQLRIIDVSHNDFTGTLRSDYFTSWKAMYTNGNDTELKYMGQTILYNDSLVLISKGVVMEMTRVLTVFTAIDFSGNKIHGNIPESISLLRGLHVLNLSSNGFTGNISSSLENLKRLESLDLSQNKISGEIPPELGNLYSLAWINISHNQLVGSIPQGTQFQRQNCSSYEGNPGLFGPSLNDICGDIYAPTSPQTEPLEPDEEEVEWFNWMAAGLGLVPGIVFGMMMGYIVALDKHYWFMKTFGRNKQQNTRTRTR